MQMSTLIAIAYPDESTAKQARAALARLQTERLVELDDAVIAVNHDGKIRLEQAVNLTGAGALGGAAWGGLLGLIFLMPIAGMAIGAASGAIGGHFSDFGVNDDFARDISRELKPDSAALFILARRATPDKVLEEMKQFGGTVLRTNLSNDAEQRLQSALSGQPPEIESPGANA
jgi:uncharacterized membrane protein